MTRKRQNRFTAGELEPILLARNDGDFYYAGAKQLRNVTVMPEGGAKKRMGSFYLSTVLGTLTRLTAGVVITAPNGGTTANINDGNDATLFTTTVAIGVTDNYVVAHYDLGALTYVGAIDTVLALLSVGANNTEFFIQYSDDNIVWHNAGVALTLTTTGFTERRKIQATIQYVRVIRTGVTDLGAAVFTLSDLNVYSDAQDITNYKMINYRFNITQSYVFVLSDKNIDVFSNKAYVCSLRNLAYTSALLPTLNWTSGGDMTFLFQEDVPVTKITRKGSNSLWEVSTVTFENAPRYDYDAVTTNPAVTLTPSAISGSVTLTAGGAAFAAGSVGQYVEGGGGRAKITAYTSPTIVSALVEVPFYSTSAIAAGTWKYITGWEDSWSVARGYPRSGAFFQSRLWIGGSKSRPRTLWASRTGDFFNFNQGLLRDTDAIEVDMDNEESIVNLLSHRTLQIFSSGGESVVAQRQYAISPLNIGVYTQSEVGSKQGLKPVVSNGSVVFVQRHGNSISSTVYKDEQGAYSPENISLYSSHLIDNPVSFAIRRSSNTEDATMILAVNNDGTLAIGAYMRDENVRAFSLATTDGLYKSICVDDEDIYTIVTRTINGIEKPFVEVFSSVYTTDSTYVYNAPGASVTIANLASKDVYIQQGYAYEQVTASNVGVIAIPAYFQALNNVHIGLGFPITIETIPIEDLQFLGEKMGVKKRCNSVTLRVYQTGKFYVNNRPAAFGMVGYQPLGAVIDIYDGEVKIEALRGFLDIVTLTITQTTPLPFTLLAITTEVK